MAAPTYKTVWISTPPRTGSTWLFNVAREVLRSTGRMVLPARVPQETADMLELAQQVAWPDTDPAKVWVLKVHGVMLRADLPHSKIITSIRDPRDVLVSFQRFMNTSFEHALSICEGVKRYPDNYRHHPDSLLLKVSYADIQAAARDVIARVAAFLDADLHAGEAARIEAQFSRERVRKLIESTDARVFGRLRENTAVERDEVVLQGNQVARAYDPATAFQSGHVSGYRDGDWRQLLTEDEKRSVHERFGDWFERHGFPAQ